VADVDQILNAVCARSEEWILSHSWRPILADPDDEPLVQLAAESGARLITTHNVRHLQPATQLNIQILKPSDFLAKVPPQ
jgi:predicted nucleic acid-binding protein